jgi:hemolysin activation/secretion protein
LGPVLKLVDAHEQGASVIGEQQPYGYGRFAQAGAQLRLALDASTQRAQRRSGVTGLVQAAFYPRALDAEESFTRVEGVLAGSLSPELPLEPELALRAGGVRLFGRYPFHEAATLGGDASLRGLPRERYTGDGSLYANAELRLALLRRDQALVPRVGVFALADVGRVFLDGESSDRWHTGWGGGIWLSTGHPRHVVSLALAQSEGQLRFYVQGGFGF